MTKTRGEIEMKRHLRSTVNTVLMTAVTMLLSANCAVAQSTYTWAGTTSGNWGNTSNWDTAPVFAAGNEFIFHAPGAGNLETYLGSSALTIGGLVFNSNADSATTIRTYSTSSGTGGSNKILYFDNGTDPVYITVEEGAEGNIAVAPGGGRTVIRSDMIITHNGTGLLTYHNNNWIDDENHDCFVIKKGPGTLQFGVAGWNFGGGVVIHEGRVRILRDDAFGTGTLTMTGGGLSAIGNDQRNFTNSYSLANTLVFSDDTDTGLVLFTSSAVGSLLSNTVMDVRGNGLVLQGPVGDNNLDRSLTKTGSGALALAAANSYGGGTMLQQGRIRIGSNDSFGTGPLTVTNGTISSNSGGARNITNNYFFSDRIVLGNSADNGDLTFSGTGTLTADTTIRADSYVFLSGAIGQTGGDRSLTKTGSANLQLTLNQVNTFAGGLNVKEGTLIVNNSESRLGTGPVTLDGGTLRYIGVSAHATIHRDLIIGDAGGTLELNTNDRIITWENPVSGGGIFTKTGAGPLVLNAVNTHTGQIVVANGSLRIEGTHTGSGEITVQGGSLGGSGTAAGTCIVEDGGTLEPGSNGIGTFTVGGLELREGASYSWELDSSTSDTVAVTGDLSLPTNFVVNVTQVTPANLRNRILFTYSGSYSGPQRADLTATGDVEPETRYQSLHDSQNKQVLLIRKPDGTIILIR